MSRIDDIFATLRSERRTALLPFLTAGFPSLDVTAAALRAVQDAGAPIVELGIPFSDPIADGPVIAGSMHHALERGVTPKAIFELVRSLRGELTMGVLAMVSDSIIERMGARRFFDGLHEAGFDGVIIPDLDLARASRTLALAKERDLAHVLLVAPTTPPARMAQIAAHCLGFVYLLARAGVTGTTDALGSTGATSAEPPTALAGQVAVLRDHTDLPVAVGFGISTAEHVRQVTARADAAIVGSAIVRAMAEADDPARKAGEIVRELSKGLTSHDSRASRDYPIAP